MKYKLSKYTHVLDNGKDFLLYNFLHKNIVKVPNNDVINDILIRQDIDLKNDVEAKNVSLVEKLIHAGYLVDINADEDYIGKLAYYDTLYDSGLLLTILASEACNFRCKYCYENFGRGNILDDVADSIILFAEKNIRNYKRLGVDWFGGEPLLAIDKIEHISKGLISICRKYGKPYTASMTTNGYLLTLDTFERLLKCKVYSYIQESNTITVKPNSIIEKCNASIRNEVYKLGLIQKMVFHELY